MQQIDFRSRQALYNVVATRKIEHLTQRTLPPHTLMQRAGLSVAQLALALAPHARCLWIACGPGNNGGDGLEAALHLQRWGKLPVVTWLGTPATAPTDAAASFQRAVEAGVTFADTPPPEYELCIDALLGIGAQRVPEGRMAEWIKRMNASSSPVLAVDVPTGLNADTGVAAPCSVNASHTLSLLTLKPGLFTAQGRDAAGLVWLDDLHAAHPASGQDACAPTAWLAGEPIAVARRHASHKGSYGDVAIIGGALGMTGAALLAACAAVHAGAGRVFVGLLDDGNHLSVDTQQPELMFRLVSTLDFSAMTVVCGCGGGDAIHTPLFKVLSTTVSAVIDADAINSIAKDHQLQALLSARGSYAKATVLTPHPLEAARLLDTTGSEVQNNRLAAAQQLAQRFDCTVVLKGSGTVIAAPDQTPIINPTGNARLATAGTGDVLAGMIGARLAAGDSAFKAACAAVYEHGLQADQWPSGQALTAGALSRSL
jgi:hydroxyethylthiazole kinase-like uncharacterized protein yjeF